MDSDSPIVIAIDGHAAAGKGTLARQIAEHYNYAYLDSGKLYRLIAYEMLNAKQELTEANAVIIAQKFNNKIPFELISDPALAQDEISRAASTIAAFPKLRDALKITQQNFAQKPYLTDGSPAKGAVIDGRDIGTVIYPKAQVKLFITADIKIRTTRRLKELGKPESSYAQTLTDIKKRDLADQTRTTAPLKKAQDAITIDTTNLSVKQAAQNAIKIINAKINAP